MAAEPTDTSVGTCIEVLFKILQFLYPRLRSGDVDTCGYPFNQIQSDSLVSLDAEMSSINNSSAPALS